MTHIVKGALTKKGLKDKLESAPDQVYFEDPSEGINPDAWSGTAAQMSPGQSLTCTNHPKRTWFAGVTKRQNGKFYVN